MGWLKKAEETGDVEAAERLRSRIAAAEARKAGDMDKADRIAAERNARDAKTKAMNREAFLKAKAKAQAKAVTSRPSSFSSI
ncbi:hypothetical protein PilKf_00751 [Pillotina sp. SPG140]